MGSSTHVHRRDCSRSRYPAHSVTLCGQRCRNAIYLLPAQALIANAPPGHAPQPPYASREFRRMSSRYNAEDIEVLSGLDPVKRRPGMYTDTTRPNHLAQEVIDNAVDEALAGHARSIEVILHDDG